MGPRDVITNVDFGQRGHIFGDLNEDGVVDERDVTSLRDNISTGETRFDLNADDVVDRLDLTYMIETILGTSFGDANLDRQVDAFDLNIIGRNWLGVDKTWAQGDFSGDGLVNAADLNVLGLNWQNGVEAAAFGRVPRAPLRAKVSLPVDIAMGTDYTQTIASEPTEFDLRERTALQEELLNRRNRLSRSIFSRRVPSHANETSNDATDALYQRIGDDWKSLHQLLL